MAILAPPQDLTTVLIFLDFIKNLKEKEFIVNMRTRRTSTKFCVRRISVLTPERDQRDQIVFIHIMKGGLLLHMYIKFRINHFLFSFKFIYSHFFLWFCCWNFMNDSTCDTYLYNKIHEAGILMLRHYKSN